MLKPRTTPFPICDQEKSPKNLMSIKASYLGATNVKPLVLEDEHAKLDLVGPQEDEMVTSLNFLFLCILHLN